MSGNLRASDQDRSIPKASQRERRSSWRDAHKFRTKFQEPEHRFGADAVGDAMEDIRSTHNTNCFSPILATQPKTSLSVHSDLIDWFSSMPFETVQTENKDTDFELDGGALVLDKNTNLVIPEILLMTDNAKQALHNQRNFPPVHFDRESLDLLTDVPQNPEFNPPRPRSVLLEPVSPESGSGGEDRAAPLIDQSETAPRDFQRRDVCEGVSAGTAQRDEHCELIVTSSETARSTRAAETRDSESQTSPSKDWGCFVTEKSSSLQDVPSCRQLQCANGPTDQLRKACPPVGTAGEISENNSVALRQTFKEPPGRRSFERSSQQSSPESTFQNENHESQQATERAADALRLGTSSISKLVDSDASSHSGANILDLPIPDNVELQLVPPSQNSSELSTLSPPGFCGETSPEGRERSSSSSLSSRSNHQSAFRPVAPSCLKYRPVAGNLLSTSLSDGDGEHSARVGRKRWGWPENGVDPSLKDHLKHDKGNQIGSSSDADVQTAAETKEAAVQTLSHKTTQTPMRIELSSSEGSVEGGRHRALTMGDDRFVMESSASDILVLRKKLDSPEEEVISREHSFASSRDTSTQTAGQMLDSLSHSSTQTDIVPEKLNSAELEASSDDASYSSMKLVDSLRKKRGSSSLKDTPLDLGREPRSGKRGAGRKYLLRYMLNQVKELKQQINPEARDTEESSITPRNDPGRAQRTSRKRSTRQSRDSEKCLNTDRQVKRFPRESERRRRDDSLQREEPDIFQSRDGRRLSRPSWRSLSREAPPRTAQPHRRTPPPVFLPQEPVFIPGPPPPGFVPAGYWGPPPPGNFQERHDMSGEVFPVQFGPPPLVESGAFFPVPPREVLPVPSAPIPVMTQYSEIHTPAGEQIDRFDEMEPTPFAFPVDRPIEKHSTSRSSRRRGHAEKKNSRRRKKPTIPSTLEDSLVEADEANRSMKRITNRIQEKQ